MALAGEVSITYECLPDQIIGYQVSGRIIINQNHRDSQNIQDYVKGLYAAQQNYDCVLEIRQGILLKRVIKSF